MLSVVVVVQCSQATVMLNYNLFQLKNVVKLLFMFHQLPTTRFEVSGVTKVWSNYCFPKIPVLCMTVDDAIVDI